MTFFRRGRPLEKQRFFRDADRRFERREKAGAVGR